MARRLFHAIVLVGTSMGAACASRDAPAPPADAQGDTTTTGDAEVDSFPSIMPSSDTGSTSSDTGTASSDTGTAKSDTGTASTDTGKADTGVADTFPGIMPPPIDGG